MTDLFEYVTENNSMFYAEQTHTNVLDHVISFQNVPDKGKTKWFLDN